MWKKWWRKNKTQKEMKETGQFGDWDGSHTDKRSTFMDAYGTCIMVKNANNNKKKNSDQSNEIVIVNQFQTLYKSDLDESYDNYNNDYENDNKFDDEEDYEFMI
jgi:hypothetical protein